MKRTKIICTIGPACSSIAMIRKLVAAGMDCARINTAHGSIDQYRKIIANIMKVDKDLPIMLDIKGPEIRIRLEAPLQVEHGKVFEVGFSRSDKAYFSAHFYSQVHIGQKVFFDNGAIETVIAGKKNNKLQLRSLVNSVIKPNKGVNIPNTEIRIPPLTAKDREMLEFAKKADVAFIALSFTRDAKDIKQLRKKLAREEIGIIAKIENHQGIKNFDEIIGAADGAMIARGDLGVEIPSEQIPVIQKTLIRKCNQHGKVAITATQMLETMISTPMPTRAETSDVANAIIDGSDAVMLSGETAVGKFPVKAVEAIVKIARAVEPTISSHLNIEQKASGPGSEISSEIGKAVCILAKHIDATKIVCMTRTGFTARMVSRFRMNKEILAITISRKVMQQLRLVYAVRPIVAKEFASMAVINNAKLLYSKGLLSKSDTVVFTLGVLSSFMKVSNRIEVHNIGDMMRFLNKK